MGYKTHWFFEQVPNCEVEWLTERGPRNLRARDFAAGGQGCWVESWPLWVKSCRRHGALVNHSPVDTVRLPNQLSKHMSSPFVASLVEVSCMYMVELFYRWLWPRPVYVSASTNLSLRFRWHKLELSRAEREVKPSRTQVWNLLELQVARRVQCGIRVNLAQTAYMPTNYEATRKLCKPTAFCTMDSSFVYPGWEAANGILLMNERKLFLPVFQQICWILWVNIWENEIQYVHLELRNSSFSFIKPTQSTLFRVE